MQRNPDQAEISRMQMYGFIRMTANFFIREGDLAENQLVENGSLNIRLILILFFIETCTKIFDLWKKSLKKRVRGNSFCYNLKPIDNYYFEEQTRDQTRMDVNVGCLGQLFVLEFKIRHGNKRHEEGKKIIEYFDYFDLTTGYMPALIVIRRKRLESGRSRLGIGTV